MNTKNLYNKMKKQKIPPIPKPLPVKIDVGSPFDMKKNKNKPKVINKKIVNKNMGKY
tara:strand:- start:344 stop:514 length:171 start_codon:yes stop_codon:yes gene_type:complete